MKTRDSYSRALATLEAEARRGARRLLSTDRHTQSSSWAGRETQLACEHAGVRELRGAVLRPSLDS
jgi:hypothetical protein